MQTQVTGLNNTGVTVGFWSSTNNASMVNDNSGFCALHGHFHNANFPTDAPASPPVDQLLGVNDSDVAVGFYTDANGDNHGYSVQHQTPALQLGDRPDAPGASLTAAAINNGGDIAGFYTNANGEHRRLPAKPARHVHRLDRPRRVGHAGASASTTATRSSAPTRSAAAPARMTHGFTWTPGRGFSTVDDPTASGTTTINGVNDDGQLVGFYTDATATRTGCSPRRITTADLS